MINSDGLVNKIKEIVHSVLAKQQSDKLGRIAPDYTSGLPNIIFDGEEEPGGKGYPFLSSYTPKAGDRVYLKAVKGSYIILGKIGRYEDGQEPIVTLPPNPTPVAPTFINGWSNYYNGSNTLKYYKNAVNQLVIRGIIKNEDPASLSVIFVLPASHWPKNRHNMPVEVQSGATGELQINEIGEVKLTGFGAASQTNFVHANVTISLD